MAGRRKGTGRPRQDLLRMQRRLAQMQDELDSARTPGARVGAAADFLRGVLKQVDGPTAEAIADDVVQALRDAGMRAYESRKGAV